MRFLVDENIPRASLHALRAAGHDVLSIAESSPGMADSDVLRMGIEQGRTLVTLTAISVRWSFKRQPLQNRASFYFAWYPWIQRNRPLYCWH